MSFYKKGAAASADTEGWIFIHESVYLKVLGSPGTCCWCGDPSTWKANCWVDAEHCVDHWVCEKHWNELWGMYLQHKFLRFGMKKIGV